MAETAETAAKAALLAKRKAAKLRELRRLRAAAQGADQQARLLDQQLRGASAARGGQAVDI
jgi:hypothetical protein